MNKAAIKNFAVEARKKLLASVKDKAGRIGITKENITEAISKGEGYAVFPTHIGIETTLMGKELKQRENLVNRIKEKGYDSVMEEVAYTWFNRIIAVRFMEINDYLPSRIRVLSSETKGKFEPDIVTQAPKVDLKLTQQEIEEIISLKEKNELDKLFRMLFIKQCNELGEVLPELFENTSKYNKDYTEILLDISYTNEDGVIRDLLKIDEADFLEAVEIIGWMYQYYNEERRNEVINIYKGVVKKEDIPAATQLFTTDWVVRYMVDNSLGKYWLERNPNSKLREKLEYLIGTNLNFVDEKISPEDIKFLDPCMGSGHILVYTFDVLMAIYEECGYSQRDAARLILQKNLYGLDIDDRAYQLAYFAVMMRARKYNRRILNENITPNLCAIQESDGLISFEQGAGQLRLDELYKETANYLIAAFKNAKEYGSILDIEKRDYDGLHEYIEKLKTEGAEDLFTSIWLNNISAVIPYLIRQANIMVQKYDIVATNPPYLNKMDGRLKDFVNKNYKDYSGDLFSVFMYRNFGFCKTNGYSAFMIPFVWMFIKTYEKLREFIIKNKNISSLIQMEYSAFEEATVPICTFVLKNAKDIQKGVYIKLSEFKGGMEVQKQKVLEAISKKDCDYMYHTDEENFSKIPGMPIAYWVSVKTLKAFNNKLLSDYAYPKQGFATGNNDRFLRFWHEVSYKNCGWKFSNSEDAKNSKLKWFPCNKGGSFRKWYGNNMYMVNWQNDGYEMRNFAGSVIRNPQFYFQEGLTWSTVTSGKLSMRYSPIGHLFETKGSVCFVKQKEFLYYLLGLLNSSIVNNLLLILSPTLDYHEGPLGKIPVIIEKERISIVNNLVSKNISISKTDWDSFETSWDFKAHPLVSHRFFDINTNGPSKTAGIRYAYKNWEIQARYRFEQLKANEEELNRIFIEIYGLQDELTPEVEDKDVTIRKADLQRDIRSFISYAVGCMFGRYSLDVEGLAYAGGEWDDSKYKTFIPDKDNIIPITDEEYFDDDIVARFVKFVKVVYGEDTLEENLDFIAEALGNKGSTSREVIRNYFLKDFYKDHVKTYQKRPIYWLFDSGKENGFKALIYLHRYNEDTVGRVRADYLHKTQAAIENAIAHCDVVLESNASASDKAKAVKQLAETRIYDQAIAHIAHQRVSLDLDDGVVANYAKFQGIVVSSEGKKSVKVDLLGKN
jgi:type II restriction/modification system DNA methylase subunit YeeA